MKARAAAVAFAASILLLASGTIVAQSNTPKRASMQYSPVSCIKAGELPLLQVTVEGKGELRAYFRRLNSTDWCSVEGTNDGPLSRVVLPKFDAGDEIEYFFVLLDGRRVVARSPRIYRAHVNVECALPSARHIQRLMLSCGDEVQGIPSSMGAGYALTESLVDGEPIYGSPDRPVAVGAQ